MRVQSCKECKDKHHLKLLQPMHQASVFHKTLSCRRQAARVIEHFAKSLWRRLRGLYVRLKCHHRKVYWFSVTFLPIHIINRQHYRWRRCSSCTVRWHPNLYSADREQFSHNLEFLLSALQSWFSINGCLSDKSEAAIFSNSRL